MINQSSSAPRYLCLSTFPETTSSCRSAPCRSGRLLVKPIFSNFFVFKGQYSKPVCRDDSNIVVVDRQSFSTRSVELKHYILVPIHKCKGLKQRLVIHYIFKALVGSLAQEGQYWQPSLHFHNMS
jgi:hypothetical protein